MKAFQYILEFEIYKLHCDSVSESLDKVDKVYNDKMVIILYLLLKEGNKTNIVKETRQTRIKLVLLAGGTLGLILEGNTLRSSGQVVCLWNSQFYMKGKMSLRVQPLIAINGL